MQKTNIEWAKNPDGSQGYTWNPITGCLNHTDGLCKGGGFPCYAYKLANGRLKSRYLANSNWCHWNPPENGYYDPFYPRFWPKRLCEGIFELGKQPKGIFVCDMGDLFGIGVPEEWTKKILAVCGVYPQHRFYLLTKQPQNLIKFSPFPENCYVGVTATNQDMFDNAYDYLSAINASMRFISLEPLLARIDDFSVLELKPRYIDWLIIGACTGSWIDMSRLCKRPHSELAFWGLGNKWTAQPRIEWVREIIEACQKANIPYFLKDNLRPLLGGSLAQDMPKGVEIGH